MIASLLAFYQSSIGKKILVALTGLVLVVFLLGHLIGNLLIFAGPHAINEYGHMLHTALHGAGVWIARAGIFGSMILHVVLTIQLTKANRAARKRRASGIAGVIPVVRLTLTKAASRLLRTVT